MALPGGAYTGVVSPFKYGAGVYPGAGVAAGGRQGRQAILHGGVGGTSKSFVPSPSASQRAPGHAANAYAVPVRVPGVEADTPFPSAGGTVTTGTGGSLVGPIRPPVHGRPDSHGPVDPGTKPPATPPFDPKVYQDSEYWTNWTGKQSEYQLGPGGLNELRAKLAGLQSRFNGMTPYEVSRREKLRSWLDELRAQRAQLGAQGLARSGRRRMIERDRAMQWEGTDAELYRTVGQGMVDSLNQGINDRNAQLLLAKQQLEMAAAERYKQRLSAQAAQTFSTQFMSYFNNPGNWQAG